MRLKARPQLSCLHQTSFFFSSRVRRQTLAQDPSIAEISLNSGRVCSNIYIARSNFGVTHGSSTVTFYETTTVRNWSESSIVSKVAARIPANTDGCTKSGTTRNGKRCPASVKPAPFFTRRCFAHVSFCPAATKAIDLCKTIHRALSARPSLGQKFLSAGETPA